MAPRLNTSKVATHTERRFFNPDAAAIVLAFALAALIRLNVIHHITW